MARSKFINYCLPESHFRNEVQVPLSHAIPPERVKRILMAALKSTPGIMEEPSPFISLLRFDPRGVLWAVRFWIKDYSQNRPVMDAVHENILRHLQVAGINISYNRIDQRLIRSDASELNKKPLKEALVCAPSIFSACWRDTGLPNWLTICRSVAIYPGSDIVRQGQNGASLFIVAEGLVHILINDNHDQEKWVADIEPGRYFGEMSLLTGQPRSASAQAATEVICYKITKETLEPIFQKQPELLEKISTIMAARQIQLCRVQSEANAEICSFEQTKNGNWFLQQRIRIRGCGLALQIWAHSLSAALARLFLGTALYLPVASRRGRTLDIYSRCPAPVRLHPLFRERRKAIPHRPIGITWAGPWDFSVDVAGDYEVHWQVSLGETLSAHMLNVLGGLMPGFLWHQQMFLKTWKN